MSKKKLVFMASGSGSNFENIVREIQAGRLDADPALLVCDKAGAGVLARAEKLKIPFALVDRKQFPSKEAFEAEIIRCLDESGFDFIVLAGYMRILSNEFVLRYWGRIINIHPSLLPAFPGAHGIRDAFEAKVKSTGVTVHFVDTGVDTGPIILQKEVLVMPGDTLESLETRIHAVEYLLYPEALRKLVAGQVPIPSLPRGKTF